MISTIKRGVSIASLPQWIQRRFRVILITMLIVYVVVWLVINLILNLPFSRSLVLSYIHSLTHVSLKYDGWITIGPTLNITLSRFDIEVPVANHPTDVSIEQLAIGNIWSRTPTLYLDGIQFPWCTVHEVRAHLATDWIQPSFDIEIEKLVIQGDLFLEELDRLLQVESDVQRLDLPIENLFLKRLYVTGTTLASPLQFNVSAERRNIEEILFQIVAFSTANEGRIVAKALYDEQNIRIHSLESTIDNFLWNEPWSGVEVLFAGSMSARHERREYQIQATTTIHHASTEVFQTSSPMHVELSGSVDQGYSDPVLQATADHGILKIREPISVPAGKLHASIRPSNENTHLFSFDMANSNLGEVSLGFESAISYASQPVTGSVTIHSISLESLQELFKDLSPGAPASIKGNVSGTGSFFINPEGLFSYHTHLGVNNLSVRMASSEIESGTVTAFVTQPDAERGPFPSLASISMVDGQITDHSAPLLIPLGSSTITYREESPFLQRICIASESPELGVGKISSRGNFMDQGGSFNSEVQIEKLDLHSLQSLLTSVIELPIPKLYGNATMTSTIDHTTNFINNHESKLTIDNFTAQEPSAGRVDTSLSAISVGDYPYTYLEVKMATSAWNIELPHFPDQVVVSPFTIDSTLNLETMEYSIESSSSSSNVWNQASFTIDDNQQFALEILSSMDQVYSPLLANLITTSTKPSEATGRFSIDAEGTLDSISATITSDELYIHHPSDEKDFLFDVSAVRGYASINNQKHISSIIEYDNPNVLYAGMAIHATNETVISNATFDHDLSSYSFDILFPDHGLLSVRDNNNSGIYSAWTNVNLQSVALPLLGSFLGEMKHYVEELVGHSTGWVHYNDHVRGETFFQINTWNPINESILTLKNAIIDIPFSYPLTSDLLPKPNARLEADTIKVLDYSFSQWSTELEVIKDELLLTHSLTFPMMGGEFSASDIRLLDWQTGSLMIDGDIRFSNLHTSQMQGLFPYLGGEGTFDAVLTSVMWDEEKFSFEGEVIWNVFSGTLSIYNLTYDNNTGYLGMDLFLKDINLAELSDFLSYGDITGTLEGSILDLIVVLPGPESDDLPKPVSFILDIKTNDEREQTISGETFERLMALSESGMEGYSGYTQHLFNRNYRYAGIGLKGIHNATQTQLYGSLNDYYFIAPSEALFSNKIGIQIKIAENEQQTKNIDFDRIWNTLLSQIKE